MANRPGTLCNLKSGKSIGAQSNFSDTFNWLVSCLDNLKGGRGIIIKWPASDTPEISLDGGESGDDGGGEGGGGGGVVDEGTPGGGSCTFTGTDATQASGNEFTFASASDSNVTVNCNNGVITIGVYYL